MNLRRIRGVFLESPEAEYGLYNFQRRSWLDQAIDLLTGDPPAGGDRPRVLVLAGEVGIGRRYFCDALRFRLGKEHGEELAVWHLDLEGFEPESEEPLGRYLLHLLEDQERRTSRQRKKTFDGLTSLARTLSNTDWSAAVLSLLWQFEDPLKRFGEVLATSARGHAGAERSEREMLRMLLDELTRDHKLLLHVTECTQIRRQYRRWLTTQVARNPRLFLAISCRPEDHTDQLVPLNLLPSDPPRFDFQPLDESELREALEARFGRRGCPGELVAALLRYSAPFARSGTNGAPPARVALKILDLVQLGAITDLPQGGDSIVWRLADEGLASQALAHGFAADFYAPIEALIAGMPRLGRELREFLIMASLCRRNVPAELLLAKLELSRDEADELIDVIDDHLVEELGLFWDLGQRHPAFPDLFVYRFCDPIMPGVILDQVSPMDREMEAASLMPFLRERLPVRRREVARLFLAVADHLGAREQKIYRKQLEWWVGTEEAEALKPIVQAEIESADLKPDLVWAFLTASGDWPAYRRLALLDAYADARTPDEAHVFSDQRALEVQLLRGHLLLDLGRYREALGEGEAVLEIVEPQTVGECQGRFLSGVCSRLLGELPASTEHLNRALELSRELMGDHHSFTVSTMDALAATLRDQGELVDARGLQEKVLGICRRVLGDEHPDTLGSMNNLASTLSELGDASGAHELHEAALAVRRRVLGEEHPDTLASMNNLAMALKALGDATEARELFEAALAVSRRVLGDEHPHTLMSMHNLCCLQEESEDADVDPRLVEALLSGIRNLPVGMPFRVEAEARWLKE